VQEQRVERRLAAILASDVAGYSRLMEADEVGTLRALKAQRKEVIDPLVAAHHGRVVKTMGDGILAEFASAVEAVGFAVAVHRDILGRNANLPRDRRIALRTGINIGDIIVEGGDIYGDGVNVAARLEALSEPGGICYRQVRDKLPYEFADRGEQTVKNIARPVHVYALDAAALEMLPGVPAAPQGPASPASRRRGWGKIWPAAAALAGVLAIALGIRLGLMPVAAPLGPTSPPRFSMVVLPFADLSGDPAQDYLADVITEGLTTALARIKDSFVIARSTALIYKGKPVDVKEIGKDLGVRYVLEGSEELAGHRLRVNAQLIDAETRISGPISSTLTAPISCRCRTRSSHGLRGSCRSSFQPSTSPAGRARPENLDAEDLAEPSISLQRTRQNRGWVQPLRTRSPDRRAGTSSRSPTYRSNTFSQSSEGRAPTGRPISGGPTSSPRGRSPSTRTTIWPTTRKLTFSVYKIGMKRRSSRQNEASLSIRVLWRRTSPFARTTTFWGGRTGAWSRSTRRCASSARAIRSCGSSLSTRQWRSS
jgi:class 3 adenylate cyclase/TolB-like protein